MKNRLMKVGSAMCALAMLFAAPSAGRADLAPEAAQGETVLNESVQAQETAGEKSVRITVSAPAAAEEMILAEPEGAVRTEKGTPAQPDGKAPVSEGEEAAETVQSGEEDPAAGDEESAAPAGEAAEMTAEQEAAPAAEEPAPAGEPAGEESAAPAPAEDAVPVAEPAPAEETAPAEGPAPAAEPASGMEADPAAEPDPAKETEEPEGTEEKAEGEKPEEPSDESGEEAPEGTEEKEPAELPVGGELTDTVHAGEEYIIRLVPSETGAARLTLMLERGQALAVRMDGEEADFTETDPENPVQAVFTHEVQVTAGREVSVALSAAEETAFTLKAEMIAAEPAAETNEEVPAEEAASGEAPAEEGNTEAEVTAEEESAEAEAASGEAAEEEMPAAEEAPEEGAEETANGETEPAPDGEMPAEAEEKPERLGESDLRMLEAGCIRVMVIRENGTALYASRDAQAEPAGSLACGDVIWAKPAGEIWGEVYLDENSAPLYFNLNNVMLQLGEVGYDVPIRKVKLSSSLEGLTEITEGTFVVMNAEISGFMADEIADITWQYRAPEDEEFTDIEDAKGFTYVYPVSAENLHYEWRIVLTIKS